MAMNNNKESLEKLLAVKNKFNYRQFFMIAVLIFATAADILIDYVQAGFNPSIFKDPAYWIMLGLTCLSVILVTLSVRDFFREKELRENSDVVAVQRQIDIAHSELMKRNLTTHFAEYVDDINDKRKRDAYKAYIQYKMSKCRRDKWRKKWQTLLDRADNDIEYLPVRGNLIEVSKVCYIKFNRVRIATIFSRTDRNKSDDENMEANEQAHINELIFRKLFTLISFSIALSTLFFEPNAFAVSILINTFSKLFRTAMSIYLGASDGQAFVKGTLLSKMNLRLDFIQKFLEKEKSKSEVKQVDAEGTAE
ncbi:MAG: hypothetical protein K2L70_00780 [Clostridia bacterium]|nr:hypothetical protein [Clostridia bacterium]